MYQPTPQGIGGRLCWAKLPQLQTKPRTLYKALQRNMLLYSAVAAENTHSYTEQPLSRDNSVLIIYYKQIPFSLLQSPPSLSEQGSYNSKQVAVTSWRLLLIPSDTSQELLASRITRGKVVPHSCAVSFSIHWISSAWRSFFRITPEGRNVAWGLLQLSRLIV